MSDELPRWYWVAFGMCQLAGLVLPAFANVHMDIAPLVGTFLLLFPGVLIALPLSALTIYFQAIVAVGVNYFIWRFIGRRLFGSHPDLA